MIVVSAIGRLRGYKVGRRGIHLARVFELLLVAGWACFGAWTVWGQAAADPGQDAKKAPAVVGHYSLITTVVELSAETHWLNPAPTIAVSGGTQYVPAETVGNLTVAAQYAIEDFAAPRYECTETTSKQRGCEVLSRTDVTIRDANTVGYAVATRGPAVQLTVNLKVHDRLPVSHEGAATDWHAGDVIFVPVAKATAAYAFVSEILVGTWQGEAIVFEAGKPLPAGAKKGLDDLEVQQDLGDSVLYGYRVKEPEKKK